MSPTWKQQCSIVIAAALSLLFSDLRVSTFTVFASTAYASDQGSFGEKKGIASVEEALKALKKHFENKDIVIGEVAEKDLYFEAEIKDRKNMVIDKVVVDKRTGRIRSIY